MKFNPISDKWKISEDKSVNYIAKFIKINYYFHQPMATLGHQFPLL